MPSAEPSQTRRSLLRTFAPWVVAAVVLGWLFYTIPAHQLAAALSRVSPVAYLLTCLSYVLGTLFVDVAATVATLRVCLPEIKPKLSEILKIRGASYLLAVINYAAGQGALAFYLKDRQGVDGTRAAGSVLLMAGTTLSLTAMTAAIGIASGGVPAQPALRVLVLAFACGFPAHLIVVALRPRFLLRSKVLGPIFDAGLKGNIAALLVRAPHFIVLLIGNWVSMRLFDIRPSLGDFLTLLPLVFFVGVVPVSPFGLGTAQVTAVALFSRFAPGATLDAQRASVLAWSLSFQFINVIMQAILGLAFLQIVSRSPRIEKPT